MRGTVSSIAWCLATAVLLAGCTDSPPSGPDKGTPGIRKVQGDAATDTVSKPLATPLVVEVRDTSGALAANVVVRFEAQAPSDTSRSYERAVAVCSIAVECSFRSTPSIDTTDANGRAQTFVQLGTVAGRAVVRIRVPELALIDSAVYTVTPGQAKNVRATVRDFPLTVGDSATVSGRVVDQYENIRPDAVTFSTGNATSVNLTVATGKVTAREFGTQYVFVRSGTIADSVRVRVVPAGRLVVWAKDEGLVRLVNTDGSGYRTITAVAGGEGGVYPRFSPDRQRVSMFYTVYNQTFAIDTMGTGRVDLFPYGFFDAVHVSRTMPDGSTLMIARKYGENNNFPLWRVAANGDITRLMSLPLYGGIADISHDGSKIAYIASPGGSPVVRVYNVASGDYVDVGTNARSSPRFSPQSDRIAYLGPITDLRGPLRVVNTDGTADRLVSSTLFNPGITWSPDGVYIVGRSAPVLRAVRVSDGVLVDLLNTRGQTSEFYQPDWR